jgi:hypothetical protein
MDVFSTELGILLKFVKTSEFRGGGEVEPEPSPTPHGTPLPETCSRAAHMWVRKTTTEPHILTHVNTQCLMLGIQN